MKYSTKDNTDPGVKVVIRKELLSYIYSPSVLECFAGFGHIYNECYRGLRYTGIDRRPIHDERNLLIMDNVKFLRSADLSEFNFFDLDAYGSPWHQLLIVLKRRKAQPGDRIAFALTDGLYQLMAVGGDLPHGMKKYVGIPQNMRIPCLQRHQDFIRRLFVNCALAENKYKAVRSMIGQNQRKNVTYLGLLLEKS